MMEQANLDNDGSEKQLPNVQELKECAIIIDPTDEHYQEYMSRKQTLLKNVETIASMKYDKNKDNYKSTVAEVV